MMNIIMCAAASDKGSAVYVPKNMLIKKLSDAVRTKIQRKVVVNDARVKYIANLIVLHKYLLSLTF